MAIYENSHGESQSGTTRSSHSPAETTWRVVLDAIADGKELPREDVTWAMHEIMSGNANAAQIAAFSFGLRVKGITPQELAAAADTMSSFAQRVHDDDQSQAVDIVGTGGDGHHTVNISTMAAFVLAGAGTPVVKHGNRAASSKCGGADLLEALGYRIERSPDELAADIARTNFGFMYAKTYHPAMRFAGPVRSELKVPTLFNLLGPMTNPANPRFGLIGCAFREQQEIMAEAFTHKGRRTLVIHGQDGMDEITISTPTDYIASNDDGTLTEFTMEPEDFGFPKAALESLQGGDAQHNAQVALDLLSGKLAGPIKHAVLMNAAAAQATVDGWESNDAETIKQTILSKLPMVTESLESGAGYTALQQTLQVPAE